MHNIIDCLDIRLFRRTGKIQLMSMTEWNKAGAKSSKKNASTDLPNVGRGRGVYRPLYLLPESQGCL